MKFKGFNFIEISCLHFMQKKIVLRAFPSEKPLQEVCTGRERIDKTKQMVLYAIPVAF